LWTVAHVRGENLLLVGAVGAVLFTHGLYVRPSAIFGARYSVYIGGLGTIEGPVLGALLFFALQQTLSGYGARYTVLLGAIAIVVTLFARRHRRRTRRQRSHLASRSRIRWSSVRLKIFGDRKCLVTTVATIRP
jgi:hypothetical protein